MTSLDRYVSSYAELRRAGLSRASIDRHVLQGRLIRVRRGWYADPGAHPDVLTAVKVGGMLSCVSALRLHGVWTMPATELHIRVTSGTIVRRSPATRLHWTHSPAERGLDHPLVAIAMAVGCLDLRAAVVAVDSAKNQGIVPPSALEAELASSPRGRLVLSHADGASESGLETLVRLALRRRRLRVRSQVAVPGVGRVDLLVGERLVIELDGRTWHTGERFQSDRDRDRLLVSAGYLVLRATYRDVMERLPELEEQVMTLVRRGDHLWRGPHNSSRDVPSSALERGRSPR